MGDDLSDIASFYDSDPEREHTRLERHQLEHELTWRYLERYLPRGGSILEVGAGTGRYTLELARGGYKVTAVDMSEALLEACRGNLEAAGLGGKVRLVQADARKLRGVVQEEFEAALLMGPLYHLVEEADRSAALGAVYDRLRPGGVIFSAFISRFGILGDLMKDLLEWIEEGEKVRATLDDGRRPHGYPKGGFRGYFARADEIIPLHEAAGFEKLALAAVEPAISADDESYNRLEGEQRRLWLDLLEEISTERSIVGASRHLLYVGRKNLGL